MKKYQRFSRLAQQMAFFHSATQPGHDDSDHAMPLEWTSTFPDDIFSRHKKSFNQFLNRLFFLSLPMRELLL